jgi:hypothetical protein
MKLMILVTAIMVWLFWSGYKPVDWVTAIFALLMFIGFVFGDDK